MSVMKELDNDKWRFRGKAERSATIGRGSGGKGFWFIWQCLTIPKNSKSKRDLSRKGVVIL